MKEERRKLIYELENWTNDAITILELQKLLQSHHIIIYIMQSGNQDARFCQITVFEIFITTHRVCSPLNPYRVLNKPLKWKIILTDWKTESWYTFFPSEICFYDSISLYFGYIKINLFSQVFFLFFLGYLNEEKQ